MTARLRHRGPDDGGINTIPTPAGDADGAVLVFGHRRLSIIDLSTAGHQPMEDPVTGNWITYNGEIYNFQELRSELIGRGHEFRSRCDTEVILKAYAEWGAGCWRRLSGIFAFGLWDARNRRLHLVRDHLGVKPLYYTILRGGVAFASEVRALLAGDCVDRTLSIEGMYGYLKYGSVQEPCTLVAGVYSLLPGTSLVVDPEGEKTIAPYWSVDEFVPGPHADAAGDDNLKDCLTESVTRQLMADVPLGVFLSGGIDSSVVAAVAARAQPGNVRTFCVGCEHPAFDESKEAEETAACLGCRHTTLMLEGRTVQEKWKEALSSYDQPSADGINTYFVSHVVRQSGIVVALSGLGGDELFVGYRGFQKGLQFNRAGRLMDWVPRPMKMAVGGTFGRFGTPGKSTSAAAAELVDPNLPSPYFATRIFFSSAHVSRLLAVRPAIDLLSMPWGRRECQLGARARDLEPINGISYLELQTYMLSTLLRDSDQMSMAHGLELRVPLIDRRLVERVLPLAAGRKTREGVSKPLLVDAVEGLLPSRFLQRRKRGFTLPFAYWLSRELQDDMSATFLGQPRGPWERRAFRELWRDFRRGRVGWSRILALYMLEHWFGEYGISV